MKKTIKLDFKKIKSPYLKNFDTNKAPLQAIFLAARKDIENGHDIWKKLESIIDYRLVLERISARERGYESAFEDFIKK